MHLQQHGSGPNQHVDWLAVNMHVGGVALHGYQVGWNHCVKETRGHKWQRISRRMGHGQG